jgi:branched-subunit amino acid aminotransferase/4-amino-4-deoxychorismate lyase
LNERGEIAECTSANIFIVQKSQVWTPPLTSGCLPGVTRMLLLDTIRVDGIQIGEKALTPDDLDAADEVFVTSTTRELRSVCSVEGHNVRRSQVVMDRLQGAFSDHVSQYLAAHPRPVTVSAK